MQKPEAADNDDVAINEVALQQAGQRSVAQLLLDKFLTGAADEDNGKDADVHSGPEAHGIETYDEFGGIDYVPEAATRHAASDSRGESAATELLRKQLLGNHARKNIGGSKTGRFEVRHGPVTPIPPPKPRMRRPKQENSSDSDADARSRVGKKSRRGALTDSGDTKSNPQSKGNAQHQDVSQHHASNAAKRGSTYLDQVLSERSAKQQKKKPKLSSEV